MSLHEFDLAACRAFPRGPELEHDESARAHRAADGRAWHRRLAQDARRRKHALFDHGIDRGGGAPTRLFPKLAHALEPAHEVVHGDAGGMNAGEIAVDEIGEQPARALQASTE